MSNRKSWTQNNRSKVWHNERGKNINELYCRELRKVQIKPHRERPKNDSILFDQITNQERRIVPLTIWFVISALKAHRVATKNTWSIETRHRFHISIWHLTRLFFYFSWSLKRMEYDSLYQIQTVNCITCNTTQLIHTPTKSSLFTMCFRSNVIEGRALSFTCPCPKTFTKVEFGTVINS